MKVNNKSLSGGVNILTQSINVPAGTNVLTSIACNAFLNGFADVSQQGAEIAAVGTIDSDNTSTLDANLINANLTDLVYNNSSAGSANKSLPGIDIGVSGTILTSFISVWWWTNATYMSSNYNIQGSNDGTTWVDIVTGLSSIGLNGQEVQIAVNSMYRYYRVFNITGNNATWVVISEMKAFAPGSTISQSIEEITDLQVTCDPSGFIRLINNDTIAYIADVNYLS